MPASALFETDVGVRGNLASNKAKIICAQATAPNFQSQYTSHERLHETAVTVSIEALLCNVDTDVSGHQIINVHNFLP